MSGWRSQRFRKSRCSAAEQLNALEVVPLPPFASLPVLTSRRAGQGMGGSGSPVVPGGGARSENETSKSALGDRKPKRRFRRQFPHTETRPYLQNAAGARGFERSFNVRRWRPDWLAGAPGFEPLHIESEFAKTLSPGGRTRTCASRIKGAPDRRLKPVEAGRSSADLSRCSGNRIKSLRQCRPSPA